jgi:asparagine synthase (glutamine-hydrolysing)
MLEQKTEKYWDVSFKKKTDLNFTDAKAELKRILTEATSIRMISDVPLGAFLSGGVDSSIIVGLMSRLSSKPIKTFSIGFEDKEFSELKYASIIAKQFNTDHHELIVKPNYVDMLKKIVWHYDQPYADCSALPSYIVSQMTRKHVTVALNGDGGDESFAGYLRFKALKISEYTSLPMKLVPQFVIKQVLNHLPMNESVDASKLNRYFHRFIQPLKEPPQRRNLIWHAYFTNELKSFIYSEDMKKAFICDDAYSYLENIFMSPQADNTLDRALYTDLTSYLPENLLIKMDIASMANSLEARSPFLDHELVEFAATLPPEWKLKFFNSKYILKETFKDILPQEILNRQKQGFSIPLGKWFRGELKDYLRDVILSSKALNRGYFDPKNLKVLVNDHIEGKADYGYCLWALLMLELWHIVFIDSEVQ